MIAVAHEADLDELRGVLGTVGGGLELPLKVVRAAWSTHRSSSPLTVMVISFDAATTARSWHKRRRRSLPEKPSRSIGRRLRADQAGASSKL
jgi:hypothetical protein